MTTVTHSDIVVESGKSFHEVYPRLLKAVIDRGRSTAPRDQDTYEISPFIFVIDDPTDCIDIQKSRRVNYAYAIVEKLSLIYGKVDPETFCFYIPALQTLLNENGTFGGAYGPRITGQLTYIYELLKDDPDSRRAVMTVYSSLRDQQPAKDIPCTISLQFLLREGRLNVITNMRSNDLYLGLPYDVQQFTFLQRLIASWLEVEIGNYTHISGSSHIYKKDMPSVKRVLNHPSDLSGETEPPVNLPYITAVSQVKAFFAAEEELRIGVATLSQDTSRYEEVGPYLQYCLDKISRFIQRRAENYYQEVITLKITDEFCTLKETAAHLGVNRLTVWRWIKAGKIEVQRAGGVVFIERSVVEKLKSGGN